MTTKEHVTRADIRDGRNGHRTEWDVSCLCGWGVSFGSSKIKRKAWREAIRWAGHHETLNDKEAVRRDEH